MNLSSQLEYLLFLQNFRDLSGHMFDNFFLHVTMLGETAVPLLLMCFIYWCINKEAGIYIILNYMCGFIVNMFLKCTFCIYRPWIFDERIMPLEQAMQNASGYSFPSGHTSGAVTSWGSIGVIFRKNKFISAGCFIIIIFVMFSRNYLGVHTPQDVIVSLIVSVLILFVMYKILEWEKKAKNRDLIILALVLIISLSVLIYVNLKSYPVDYANGQILFNPASVKTGAYYKTGWITGVFSGWVIEKRYINYNPSPGKLFDKILRFIIGSLIVFYMLSINTDLKIFLFIIYFINGLFITAIYPFIIKYIQNGNRFNF